MSTNEIESISDAIAKLDAKVRHLNLQRAGIDKAISRVAAERPRLEEELRHAVAARAQSRPLDNKAL